MKTLGDGIYRCEVRIDIAMRLAQLIFRVHHLQRIWTGPDLAEAAQLGAAGQHPLLSSVEVEEAQGQTAGSITESRDQHAPAP
jgi:hypothetical protein